MIKLDSTNTEQKDLVIQEKPPKKVGLRVTAGILVVALLASISANAAVGIRITPGDRSEAAATNYLVDNTDYVQEGRLGRIGEKVQTLSKPQRLEDYYRLAGTQIAEEKYPQALDSVTMCLTLCEKENHDLYVDLLMKQGCLMVLLSQNDEALKVLDLAIEEQPDLADAYLVKAQIYAAREENEPLAASLTSYMALRPQDREIRSILAQTLYLTGEYQQAADEFAAVLSEAEPEEDITETAYLYGLTCLQLEDYENAVDALSRARERDPDLETIDYYLGICQMSLQHYGEAVEDFTASVDKNLMVQLSRYSRGICRLMTDPPQLLEALDDLVYAAEDQSPEADPAVAGQALDLLQELAKAEQSGVQADSAGTIQE